MTSLLRLVLAGVIVFGHLGVARVAQAALWLADSQRAYRIDTHQNLVHWVDLQPGEHGILTVGGGKAWFVSHQGGRLIDADGNAITTVQFDSAPSAFTADAARGDLFVATTTGILRFDLQGQAAFVPGTPEPVTAMRATTGGELWALTKDRLYRFSKETGWNAEIDLAQAAPSRPSDFYVDRLRGIVWLVGQAEAKALVMHQGAWTERASLPGSMANAAHAFDSESGILWRIQGGALVGHVAGEKTSALDRDLGSSATGVLRYDSEERTLWWKTGARLVAWHLPSGKRLDLRLDDEQHALGAWEHPPEFELGLLEPTESEEGVLPFSVQANCGQRPCAFERKVLDGMRLFARLSEQTLEPEVIDWEVGQVVLRLPENLADETYPLEVWIESPTPHRVAEFALLLNKGEGRLTLAIRSKANQAPSISITAPSNNAVFHAPATIDLQVSASDPDGAVKQVSYYRGTTLIGTSTTAPFSYLWSNVGKGTYKLTAKATDNSGASTKSAAITVIVNQLPTVSLTAPANNASFAAPANVTLTASASDSDGSIAKVEFFEGSNLLGTKTASPFTMAWNNVAAGSYTLTAKATDNRGGSKTSAAVAIKVNGVAPPTVNMTAPADNTTILSTATLTLKATAKSVGSTISKVEFYDGSTLLGSVTGSSATVYAQLTRSGFSVGDHVLTAKAFDAKGQSTISSAIRLRVESAGPTVRITTPAEGAFFSRNAPVHLAVEASSRQGSITLVEYFDQDVLIGSVDYSPFEFFWYGVQPGDHVLTAKATDSKGAIAASAPVNISVSSNIAPTIGFSYTGETFRVPATLTLTAYAADEDGSISKVEFFEGTRLLGTVTQPPFELVWADVARGIYQVSARATDNQGTSASTNVYEIHVDDTLPTVAFTSPNPGSTLWVGQSHQISVAGTVRGPPGTSVQIFEVQDPNDSHGAQMSGESFAASFYPRFSGTGTLVAKAITLSGASAQVSLPVKVLQPQVWFTDPGQDATTFNEQFVVRGGYAAPQIEALTVNGQAAPIDGARFSLGSIPLTLGANFLTAEMTAVLPGGERVTTSASAVITRLATSARTLAIDSIQTYDATRVGGLPQVSLGKMWLEVQGTYTGGPDTQVTVEDGQGNRVLARLNAGIFRAPLAVAPGESTITARAFGPSGREATATASAFGFPPSGQSVALVRMAKPDSCSSIPSAPGSVTLEAQLLPIGTLPIVGVEFSSVERGVIGQVTQPPYSLQWNNIAAGVYHVRARAMASAGNSAYSLPVTVGVGQAISCELIAPPAQTDNYYIHPANVNLEAKVLAFGGEVEKVDFLRDGVLLATKLEKPYQYTWQNVPKGRFFLTARATTKGGVTASSQTTVTVADLSVALRARDTEFNQGLEDLGAPAKLSLTATPSVYGTALDHIDFIASGTVISRVSAAPYEFWWQNVAPGTYDVIARAYGSNGATADSAPVTIKVAPLWVMLDPSTPAQLNAPGRFLLRATSKAWQSSGARLEYYAGDTLLGSGTAINPSVEWKDIPAGNYTLTAKVFDSNGKSATSLPKTLNVFGPPTVQLIAPLNGATAPAGGSITLEAEATAPGSSVNNVVFYRGSTQLGSDATAPYQYQWTNLPLGTHTLTASTSTPQGMSATSAPITLNVTNDPGASITEPRAGQSLPSGSLINIVVQATMPLRAIDRVEIFADGALLTTVTANGAANYMANHNWADAAIGPHVLKATAYAKDGTKVDTAEVAVTVVGPIKVRLDSPHPLMTILASDTFHLSARALQEAGRITAVQFYAGDTLLATVETEPYVFAWKNPPVGIHRLRARAIDATGRYADTPITAVRA
ncbi:MAG: Ig-like domain-containing protein, partial [Betaproteobacteria bacterium]|nr:Ig-like domain-containing protein [Betaproteobacteria bacterium]